MHFAFNDDQREIKQTARDVLTKRSTPAAVREAAESEQYDDHLWRELVELGWPGIAIHEDDGGIGLGTMELTVVLEEAGYALAASPLLATTCAALIISEAGSDEQRAAWLPGLADGSRTGAFGTRRADGTALVLDPAPSSVIVVLSESGDTAELLEPGAGQISAFRTIDPTRRYGQLDGRGESLPGDTGAGVDRALVAVSAELVGICQRALDMTVAYVTERKQFDRPVGAFQAVSHRCAEMLLATEGARSAMYAAAWAADADPDGLREAAQLAKISASDAGKDVTASAIQAHGGIGFTWEADVHWLYKRAQLDAAILGGAGTHRQRLAAAVGERIASRTALA